MITADGKTVIRENIEWISIRWHNAPDTEKPRVLLIGDSIVAGHGTRTHDLLKETACVDFFATAKHVTDVDYMSELEFMLAKRDYELILFNNGLHGFGIEDELYKPGLLAALKKLQANPAKLCWRTSTPILDKEDLTKFNEERTPRVLRRNADALAVAEELGLPVLDLYTPMAENKHYFNQDAVHYTEEGQQAQAEMVAAFIREQLQW